MPRPELSKRDREQHRSTTGSLSDPGNFVRLEEDGSLSAGSAAAINSNVRGIISTLNGGISFGDGISPSAAGHIDGQWLRITFPATPDTQVAVPHGLKRTPVGFIIMRKDRAADIYEANSGGWGPTTLYLKSSVASATVTIVVL